MRARSRRGAVRAQQADDFAAAHFQRDVAHHEALAVTFLQPPDNQGASGACVFHHCFPAEGEAPGPEAGAGAPAAGPVRRHCWVQGLEHAPGHWPGLLVEWRRSEAGVWEGRVVYLVTDAGAPVLVEAWLAAAHLAPG